MVLADSLEGALGQLNAACELGSSVETVYVIGGSALYADAIGRPEPCQLPPTLPPPLNFFFAEDPPANYFLSL